jgi:hypothetical protein
MTSTVAVSLPAGAVRARYALGVLLSLLGIAMREAPRGEPAEVAYGDRPGRLRIPAGAVDGWDDPAPNVRRVDGLPVLERSSSTPASRDGPIGFDLLYATYACLTAPWERTDPADEVGCPVASAGWLARNGLLEEPLVHRYAMLLGDALGAVPARRPAIVLTHDVDDNFGHLFGRRQRWEFLRRDLAAGRPAASARRLLGLVRSSLVRGRDPNDRFEDWAAWHAKWGSRPTYFAASHGLFEPGSARQDVPYDLRHPEVRAVLRRAREEGAEIGVHLSIGARSSAAKLRAEREALEDAVNGPVRSARHHWWALGRPPEPTWRLHGQAGIELDCSLGFNDRAGFRRGIAAPFHPFDTAANRALPVLALPTIAMDAAVAAEAEELRRLWRSVDGVGGTLVLDWHVHSANPRALPGAAAALRAFVDEALAHGARMLTPLELLGESAS